MITEFTPKSLCILGRQPALGLAELESLHGAKHIKPIEGAALLDIDAQDINFERLGGTIKVARVLNVLPTTTWSELTDYLIKTIPQHLQHLPDGKFTLGISTYNLHVSAEKLNKNLLQIKKIVKATGRPVRIVPNKEPALNSAQVLHNKLTHRGAWELILIKNGNETVLAQTMFVQDIDAYAARDQARPARDARVGMLPPKLAQIIVNLAVRDSDPKYGDMVLDPFCGTGVVLQEASLMGFDISGTDIDPRMVEYTDKNLRWLLTINPNIKVYSKDGRYYRLEIGDAATYRWGGESFVASEVFLGQPMSQTPDRAQLTGRVKEVNEILVAFLNNLHSQIDGKTGICLAVPAWKNPKGGFIHLPLLDAFDPPKAGSASTLSNKRVERVDNLTSLGYNRKKFVHVKDADLVYFRPDQIVARELVVLEKV